MAVDTCCFLSKVSIKRGLRHARQATNLADRVLARAVKLLSGIYSTLVLPWASAHPATGAGALQALIHALHNQIALELRKRLKDLHHKTALRRSGVKVLFDGHKLHSVTAEPIYQLYEVLGGATQPRPRFNHHGIAVTHFVLQPVQLRADRLRPRIFFCQYLITGVGSQYIRLPVIILICGAHTRITIYHIHMFHLQIHSTTNIN